MASCICIAGGDVHACPVHGDAALDESFRRMDERVALTPAAVEAEMRRIRAAIAPSDGGDKEDLITYAKEVVALRAAAVQ